MSAGAVGLLGGAAPASNCTLAWPIFCAAENAINNPKDAAYMLSIVVFYTLFLETLVHKLEHWVHGMQQMKRLVEKFFKEVMLLGMISLTLFIVVQSGSIGHDSKYFLPLEWVHFLIFVIALLFIFQGVVLVFIVVPVQKGWDRCMESTSEQIRLQLDEDGARMGHAGRKSCRFSCFYGYNAMAWLFSSHMSTMETVEFKLLRGLFYKMHRLPQTFDFTRYCQDHLLHMAVDMVEVGFASWALIVGMAWAYALTRQAGAGDNFKWWLTLGPYIAMMVVMFVFLHLAEANIVKTLNKFGFNVETCKDMKRSLMAMDDILEKARNEDENLSKILTTDTNVNKHGDEGATKNKVRSQSLRSSGKQVMMKVEFNDLGEWDVKEDVVDKKSALKSPKIIQFCLTVFLGVQNYMMAMYEHVAYYGLPVIPYLITLIFILPRLLRAQSLLRCVEEPHDDTLATVTHLSHRTERVRAEIYEECELRAKAKVAHALAIEDSDGGTKESAEVSMEDAFVEVFQEMDLNGDGRVTKSEFRKVLHVYSIFVRDSTFNNLWRIVDPDRSGKMELDEFQRFIQTGMATRVESDQGLLNAGLAK